MSIMDVFSGLLGTAGGQSGTGMNTLSPSELIQPTTAAQANTAYTGSQNALTQQQNLLNAIQAQNGLSNQSNVYGQLQNIASGQGPNPAQAMLNQATGQNVASQAALMAGQRGSGANAGLMARQAAQQGAATQQQAVGKGATMQANQSLAALGQAGQMANTQAAQQIAGTGAVTGAQMGEQSTLLNAIQGQNNANVGLSQQQAGLANTQLTGQQNLLGNITGGIGAAFGLAQGGVVPTLMADGGQADSDDTIPNTTTNYNASNWTPPTIAAPSAPQSPASSGPRSTIGQHMNWSLGSKPGSAAPSQLSGMALAGNTIGQGIGKGLKSLFSSSQPGTQSVSGGAADSTSGGNQTTPDAGASQIDPDSMKLMAAHGGKVPALVSPGEIRIKAKDVKKVAEGKKSPMSGEKIPGKPKVGGAKNDYANDTVPKTLNEGDIILPRSVTQSKNPHWAAHKFVQDIMMQKHRKK